MTFIDWSDAEGMFGLLLEFVTDEKTDGAGDRERLRFLDDLSFELRSIGADLPQTSASVTIERLRQLLESIDPEDRRDPASVHLERCLEELVRVEDENRRRSR